MSRSRALEVRCAPGKREACANCGPLPQSLRTICRSAPSGRPTVAHSHRRRNLWENCARVQASYTAQTRSRTSVRVARSRPQRSAILRTEWRKHRRMPTVGKRRLQALCVPSQPAVPTVWGLEVGDSASASWAHAPEAASSASAEAASVTVAPRMPPPPTVLGTVTPGYRAQVGFSSASTCAGSCSGCVTVRPTMAGRPQAISARDQSSALRPNPETQASQGTPQGRRERAFATASVRPPMEGRRNDGRTRHTPAVALRSRRLRLRCGVRDQRWSCRTKPAARLAGHSSGCWPQTSGRGGRKLSGAATHAASYSSLSNGTQRLLPRDGAMVSPHTVLFAPYTVWDQRWNHPIVCLDSSPTTKSVGLRPLLQYGHGQDG